ncbi:DUF559 domain-containing protein [Microbacterium sp.]|uniref:endonuclease domain-containing protein n=1 Tax=Microbacterium sp. TaxID=51671 RepID=UPI0028122E2F|nr:DUF559 domain-containing protein [Microbacterium sp.]
MDPITVLIELGGVARYQTLMKRGVTRHRLSAAIASGTVDRVRIGWLALPTADTDIRRAASFGVVLSCVTLLRRRNVWTLPVPTPHVAIHPKGNLAGPTAAHVHWATPIVPRDPDVLEDRLVNALVIAATCQPYERGLAAWESAIRQQLVDTDTLRRLALPPDARRLLSDAKPFADAGGETIVSSRLRWTKLPMRRQAYVAGHPVDLLIGERLVVQIDGGHHVDAQRLIDNEHDARLRLMGYHVIRIGHWQIIDDWVTIEELILTAVAQGLHLARR